MVGLMKHLTLIIGRATSQGRGGREILEDERMTQQLSCRPPLGRIPLKTARNEIPELSGSGLRGLGGFGHANGAHEGGPITLPSDGKRKPSQIEF